MIVEPRCVELAEWFFEDGPRPTPRQVQSLARAIQRAVDDWFDDQEGT